jgi:cytoskeletal protein CcmA (bactofilin family)
MKLWRKSDQISGFLDQGTSITGELQFSNTLRIDGNFHGSITSGDMLIVGEHAVVHADIKVGEIEIHGQVFGNVEVKRRAEISSTGRLRGDIQTSILIVQAGAVLDGKSQMASDQANRGSRESTRIAAETADERARRRPGQSELA